MKRKQIMIGTRSVDVHSGHTIAKFSQGRMGKSERGLYHFWTAVCLVPLTRSEYWRFFFEELWRLKQDFKASKIETIGYVCIYGRARRKLDAGERFRRIEHEIHEDQAMRWHQLQFVRLVRPSTPREVGSWLITHPEDAPYLTKLEFRT